MTSLLSPLPRGNSRSLLSCSRASSCFRSSRHQLVLSHCIERAVATFGRLDMAFDNARRSIAFTQSKFSAGSSAASLGGTWMLWHLDLHEA